MTTEEKAKAYDEAIECFKTFKEKYYTKDTNLGDVIFDKTGKMQKDFESIFPELTESEDEKMRKFLLRLAERCNENSIDFMGDIKKKDVIAYLKKQKEQLPVRYLPKQKVFDIMNKLTNLSYSEHIPIDSEEYVKIHEITSDVNSLLDYPIEQKPAEWSEEDEDKLEQCIRIVSGWEGDYDIVKSPYSNFLKSLRPQPKQDCSACPENIEGYINGRNDALREMSDFINSREIPPQPHWKPSEEQLEALLNAEGLVRANNYPENAKILASLYEQLKKLGVKEEPEYYQHFDPDC